MLISGYKQFLSLLVNLRFLKINLWSVDQLAIRCIFKKLLVTLRYQTLNTLCTYVGAFGVQLEVIVAGGRNRPHDASTSSTQLPIPLDMLKKRVLKMK